MKLAAYFLAAVAILAAQPPAGELCAISGRVVNAANGEPVRRARLLLRPAETGGASGSPTVYTTLTDERGWFAMKDIEQGKYRFSAEHSGFATTSYGARRPGGTGITLTLDTGKAIARILFRLTPQAVITGRIMDPEGDPLVGASVQVARYSFANGKRELVRSGWSSTDDLGEYRIFGLAPGRYYLEANYRNHQMPMMRKMQGTGDSYMMTYYPGTTDAGHATAVDLVPGAQLKGMDFALAKGRTFHVQGHVNVPEGVDRQRVFIMLASRTEFEWGRYLGRVDAQGAFEITGVRPGVYTINANAQDKNKSACFARQPVEVSGNHVEGVVLNLSAGIEIPGRIRFEGQPPSNLTEIKISLDEHDRDSFRYRGSASGEAKEDGSFTVANVGSDLYEVRISELPDGYYLKSVRIGDDELKETGIDTTRGAPGPVMLTISANAGHIEGLVHNAKDQLSPGAIVVLVPEPRKRERPGAYKQVTTDQHGRFELKTIEPGEYKLFAWDDLETGEYMDPGFLKPVEERGYAITIREGSRETADLKLIPRAGYHSTR